MKELCLRHEDELDTEPVIPEPLGGGREVALRFEEGGLVPPPESWDSDGRMTPCGTEKAIRFPNSEQACQFVESRPIELVFADPGLAKEPPRQVRQRVSLGEGDVLVTQRFLPGCWKKAPLQATRTTIFIEREERLSLWSRACNLVRRVGRLLRR